MFQVKLLLYLIKRSFKCVGKKISKVLNLRGIYHILQIFRKSPRKWPIYIRSSLHWDTSDLMKPMTVFLLKVTFVRGFPGGPVVKNSSCNARDTGSIPGLGRSNMLGTIKLVCHNYGVHVLQLLKPVCPEPVLHKRRHHDGESSPYSPQLKRACVQQQRPTTAKNINLFFFKEVIYVTVQVLCCFQIIWWTHDFCEVSMIHFLVAMTINI